MVSDHATTRETVNLRYLAILLGIALAFGVVWWGVHRWQVRKHAAALLEQADLAESQGRPDRAARLLGMYVSLLPADKNVRARYGMLLARVADSPRARAAAMGALEQALMRDPGRQDVRRCLVLLCLESVQYDDAFQHVSALLESLPKDPEVHELLGRCHEARGERSRAAKEYQIAIRRGPHRIEPYLRLARLLRDHLARPAEADRLLEEMIKANKESFRAYVGRARYLQEGPASGQALEAANKDIVEALRLAPDEAEVLLAAGELFLKMPAGIEKARDYLSRATEQQHADQRAYETLAALELKAGRPTEAAAALRLGLEKLPDAPSLLWNLTSLTITHGDLSEAEELLTRLRRMAVPTARVNYLGAALRLKRGDWAGACHGLETVRPLLADSRELTVQCDLRLALCYGQLGDLDARAQVYRRVIALDPLQVSARLALATTYQKLGRGAEALEECRRAVELPGAPAAGRTLLARLMVLQTLRLAPRHRQWDKVVAVLDQAAKADPDSPELAVLRAEVLVEQGKLEEARAFLDKMRQARPKQIEPWTALADLAVRQGKLDEALRLIREAEKRFGDTSALRLARLRLLLAAGDTEAKSLGSIETDLDKLSVEEQTQVLAQLVEAYESLRQPKEARRLCAKVVQISPADLGARLKLFDLALQEGDEAGMKAALDGIRRLEGESGPLGRYNEARRLIWAAARAVTRSETVSQRRLLATARLELDAVAKRRPGWARVPLALGQIDDLQGNEDRAIQNYLEAISHGERQLDVVRRAVELLYKRRRYAEAELVIQRLPEQAPLFGDLQRLAAEVFLRNGNYARALDLAATAVPPDSKDYRDHLWLGQVLWVAAQRANVDPSRRRIVEERAEQALRHAVELAGDAPDARVALVQHLIRTGRAEDAAAAVRAAEAELPSEHAPLALAQCYAALGKPDKAKELFRAALAARPNEPDVLGAAIDFYLRTNDLAQAKVHLGKLIPLLDAKDRAAAARARSVLAVVLAAGQDGRSSREALALVGLSAGALSPDRAPAPSEGGTDLQRARAAVLATRPTPRERQQAIDILEKLGAHQPLSPEDQYLLVQLYERAGNTQKARDRMLLLLRSENNPRYLAHHIQVLLGQGRLLEAETWLADLEKLQPEALRTVFFQAQLLKARGDRPGAVALLKKQAASPHVVAQSETAPQRMLRVAQLIEELGEAAEAEGLYRRYVGQSKEPEAALILAQYLGRRLRVADALDLCAAAWKTCSAEAVAETCLAILHAAPNASTAQHQRVERWLSAALEKEPKQAVVLVCMASLQELRGNYDKAEAGYRAALAVNARNALALNNLAWLLVLRGGVGDPRRAPQKAVDFADRAIDALGPLPELLDTRAMARMATGQIDLARADLEEALALPALDAKVRASLRFHLAQTLLKAGKRDKARKIWRQARDQGLTADILHPLERPAYKRLSDDLE
jgi:tetratricopeptide (TPR) repeat protein